MLGMCTCNHLRIALGATNNQDEFIINKSKNMINKFFNDRSFKLLDGAVGTMIQKRFVENYSGTTWMNDALLKHPDYLVDVHRQYIQKGADIITTMTFRTNIHAIKDIK
jgi:methionine synthase I (cobalamin-dependent)